MKKLLLMLSIAVCTIANAQFTNLYSFTGGANGYSPYGDLISDGTFLYGMTQQGGTSSNCNLGCGTIFKIKLDGTGYFKLLDFTGTANGGNPHGSLISDGTFLYGMTFGGGANSDGVIFKIKPDGTGYAKLLDFAGATNGKDPSGSLISDGTFLYGMTQQGGTGYGNIFKIMPNGTGYANLYNFTPTPDGNNPIGSLYSDGTFFYGMTSAGGTNNMGTIFKIKPDGTGYAKLLDFAGTTNGSGPYGSLISDGIYLYGMTSAGGANGAGTIFKIKPDGTGYVKLLDFASTANGSAPRGSLISDGTFLYGMTTNGGTSIACGPGCGVIFKIKLDGTGYSKLLDFADVNTPYGSNPYGSFISVGTVLYGMTNSGGTNNNSYGTIFKYGLATSIAENNVANDFSFYPNPTTGSFIFNSQVSKGELEIYNVMGEKVYLSKIISDKSEIDLSKQPNGIYFLQIKTSEGIATKKIVINK